MNITTYTTRCYIRVTLPKRVMRVFVYSKRGMYVILLGGVNTNVTPQNQVLTKTQQQGL